MRTLPSQTVANNVGALTHHDLSFLLVRAFYSLRGMLQQMLSESGLDKTIRPGMGPVLYALYESDDCTVTELAERVVLSPSTIMTTVKRMQSGGLLRLRKDVADRRVTRVRLTAKARKLEPALHELRNKVRNQICADLDPAIAEELKGRLAQVVSAMEAYDGEPL